MAHFFMYTLCLSCGFENENVEIFHARDFEMEKLHLSMLCYPLNPTPRYAKPKLNSDSTHGYLLI